MIGIKTVIITGCSSGIGFSLANKFIEEGWVVFATARTPEKLNFKPHKNLIIRRLDLTINETMDEVINEVINSFGKIDLVIQNAGFGLMGIIENTSLEDIQKQFDVNFFGVVNLTKKILPQMRKQREGQIIFVSSIVGKIGLPGFSPYVSSKFALDGFIESLRYEVKNFNIILNLVLPGSVESKFFSNRQISKNQIEDYNSFQAKLEGWDGGSYKTTSDKVAKKIFKISKNKSRRLRNYVTQDAKWVRRLKRIFPESLVFYFVEKVFNKK